MGAKRILVVDDSARIRDFLARTILPAEGYEVAVACDGQEGLALALANPPDLIITDAAMPNMTGLELIEAIRRAGHHTPIILITGQGSEELAVHALRLGVTDYFIKPPDLDELMAAITRALHAEPTGRNLLMDVLWQMECALLVIDDEGVIQLCNPAAQAALVRPGIENPVGYPLAIATGSKDLLDLLGRTPATDGVHGEIDLEDGRTLNAQVSHIMGLGDIVVMQDITYLKELDRAKTEFVTTVSHDLRSPLTAILSYVHLTEQAGPLDAMQQEFLARVRNSVLSITHLLTDLLELSRIEAGLDGQHKPVHLEPIIDDVVEEFRPQADRKRQTLQTHTPAPVSRVLGSPMRLRQVVANLAGNAIKYTPEDGKITLSLSEEGGQVVLRVSDNGIGIPPADQPHIFEKFYRASGPAQEQDGTGLGLSIVKTIIDAHGGRIWVDSRAGEGTTFTVVFPVHHADDGSLHQEG
jgi:two-component system phosphate regulon sensor histidine kinase PhoR